MPRAVYLDTPEQWADLAVRLRRARVFGLDTEFYGTDLRKDSTVGTARIHVWSVAIRRQRRSPRGFHECHGFVLPAAALEHPQIRAVLEDASVRKAIHNQAVDDHAMHNAGVRLRGAINTLPLARWTWAGLGAWDLKGLVVSKLGRAPVCEYLDVVRDEREITLTRERSRKVTVCSCGVAGCRARKGHTKSKETLTETVTRTKIERFEIPLAEIVPPSSGYPTGHPRFQLLVDYAAEDAIAAIQVLELAQLEPEPAEFPAVFGGVRPRYSQAAEDAIVAMERVGIPIDVPWAAETIARARADETAQLDTMRPLLATDCGDKTWSSPKKLIAMFDSLRYPRSPVWAKGQLKHGVPPKVDGTALQWIADHHAPARTLVRELLQLKRIRAQLKYLARMDVPMIYPVTGPMSDGDSRVGAITGRLAIKGKLASQQLPSREEVDLYHIRRGIIAGTKEPSDDCIQSL